MTKATSIIARSLDRKPKPCWLKRLDLANITAPAYPTDPANLRINGRPITASADPSALGGDEGEEGEAAKERDVGEVALSRGKMET